MPISFDPRAKIHQSSELATIRPEPKSAESAEANSQLHNLHIPEETPGIDE